MRVLEINAQSQRKVQDVVCFAVKPENWAVWEPGATKFRRGGLSGPEFIPGDDPSYTVHLNTYCCVFTWTKSPQGLFRHLTVSVPSEKYPNELATAEIARMFGFTGWDGTYSGIKRLFETGAWLGSVNKGEHSVGVTQRISPSQK